MLILTFGQLAHRQRSCGSGKALLTAKHAENAENPNFKILASSVSFVMRGFDFFRFNPRDTPL
jgi:hypothetical protein